MAGLTLSKKALSGALNSQRKPKAKRRTLHKLINLTTLSIVQHFSIKSAFTFKMGLTNIAEKAVEQKVYAEGGYPALLKYKTVRLFKRCGCM